MVQKGESHKNLSFARAGQADETVGISRLLGFCHKRRE